MLAAAASEWLNAMTSKKLAYFFDKLRDYLKKSNCDLQVKMNRDSVWTCWKLWKTLLVVSVME